MPTPNDPNDLAERILADVQAVVARLATLRADANVLSNLAQGVAMTVVNAMPAPEAPVGTLVAEVAVGPASEVA